MSEQEPSKTIPGTSGTSETSGFNASEDSQQAKDMLEILNNYLKTNPGDAESLIINEDGQANEELVTKIEQSIPQDKQSEKTPLIASFIDYLKTQPLEDKKCELKKAVYYLKIIINPLEALLNEEFISTIFDGILKLINLFIMNNPTLRALYLEFLADCMRVLTLLFVTDINEDDMIGINTYIKTMELTAMTLRAYSKSEEYLNGEEPNPMSDFKLTDLPNYMDTLVLLLTEIVPPFNKTTQPEPTTSQESYAQQEAATADDVPVAVPAPVVKASKNWSQSWDELHKNFGDIVAPMPKPKAQILTVGGNKYRKSKKRNQKKPNKRSKKQIGGTGTGSNRTTQNTKNVRESKPLGSRMLLSWFAASPLSRPIAELAIDKDSIERLKTVETSPQGNTLAVYEKQLVKFNDAIINDETLGEENRKKWETLMDGYSAQYFTDRSFAVIYSQQMQELAFVYAQNVLAKEVLSAPGGKLTEEQQDASIEETLKNFKDNVDYKNMTNFSITRKGVTTSYTDTTDYMTKSTMTLKDLWDKEMELRIQNVKKEYLTLGEKGVKAFKEPYGFLQKGTEDIFKKGKGYSSQKQSLFMLIASASGIKLETTISPYSGAYGGYLVNYSKEQLGQLDTLMQQFADYLQTASNESGLDGYIKGVLEGVKSSAPSVYQGTIDSVSSAIQNPASALLTTAGGFMIGYNVGTFIKDQFKIKGQTGDIVELSAAGLGAAVGFSINNAATFLTVLAYDQPLFAIFSIAAACLGYNAAFKIYESTLSGKGQYNKYVPQFLGVIGAGCYVGGGMVLKDNFDSIIKLIGITVNSNPGSAAAVNAVLTNATAAAFPVWLEMFSTVFIYGVAIPFIIGYLYERFSKNKSAEPADWLNYLLSKILKIVAQYIVTMLLYTLLAQFLTTGAGVMGVAGAISYAGYYSWVLTPVFSTFLLSWATSWFTYFRWWELKIPYLSTSGPGLSGQSQPVMLYEWLPNSVRHDIWMQDAVKNADALNGVIWETAKIDQGKWAQLQDPNAYLNAALPGEYYKTALNPGTGNMEPGMIINGKFITPIKGDSSFLVNAGDITSPNAGTTLGVPQSTAKTEYQSAWDWLKQMRSKVTLGVCAAGAGISATFLTYEYTSNASDLNGDIKNTLDYLHTQSETYEFSFTKLEEYIQKKFKEDGDVPNEFKTLIKDMEIMSKANSQMLDTQLRFKELIQTKIDNVIKSWAITEASKTGSKQVEATLKAAEKTAAASKESATAMGKALASAIVEEKTAQTSSATAGPPQIQSAPPQMQAASLPTTASPPTTAAGTLPPDLTKAIKGKNSVGIATTLLDNGINISSIEQQLNNKGIYEDVLAQYNEQLAARDNKAVRPSPTTGLRQRQPQGHGGKKTKRSRKQKKRKHTRRNK